MEQENVTHETINVINSDEHYKELDNVLNKYFNTLEEQQKIKEEKEKEQEKINAQSLEEETSFNEQLLQEIKVLQDYQKYGNNLQYVEMVLIGLVFCLTLMYKFLKNFI